MRRGSALATSVARPGMDENLAAVAAVAAEYHLEDRRFAGTDGPANDALAGEPERDACDHRQADAALQMHGETLATPDSSSATDIGSLMAAGIE